MSDDLNGALADLAKAEAEIERLRAGIPVPTLITRLQNIHSALDDALGDSDIEFHDDTDLRTEYPTQWAAMKLAEIIAEFEGGALRLVPE